MTRKSCASLIPGKQVSDQVHQRELAKAAYHKAKNDFVWFFENLVKIRNHRGQLVSPKMNPPQQKVWREIDAALCEGRRAMVFALKARQQGMTTLAMAIIAWRICFYAGQGAIHVNRVESAGKKAMDKLYEIIANLPEEIRPEEGKGCSYGDLLNLEPLKSSVLRDSAENVEVGRGMTIQTYHLTETPWWRKVAQTMGALLPSIPDEPGIIVFLETTGDVVGDWTYDLWVEAMREGTPWKAIFTAWFELPSYRREWERHDKPLSKWELAKCEQFGLDSEQMLWYRYKLAEFNGDQLEMRRAYPFTWQEAFAVGGRLYFDRDAIDKYEQIVAKSKPVREGFVEDGVFRDAPGGDWRIYRRPVKGRVYIIAADVAQGTSRDRSSADILDAVTLDQVASFLGKLDPDEFGVQLAGMGYAYNTALIACERNNEGGATNRVLTKRLNYPRVFYHFPEDTRTPKQDQKPGWLTSHVSRPTMLSQLAEMIRTFEVKIRDPRTLAEIRTFVWPEKSDKPQATSGGWDDSVISLAVAVNSEVRAQAYTGVGDSDYDVDEFEPAVSLVTGW